MVLFSGLGVNSYRLAAEGEELHAATLYFDVLEEAQAVGETSVTVEPVTDARGFTFGPWIGVRHKNGLNTGEVVVESQVEPVEVVGGRIALRPDNPLFTRGDCNGEGREDVTDAIFILNFNFLGALEPPCLAACDANGDGRVTGEITDALYMLNYSFLEGPPPVSPFPDCGRGEMPADRNLGCKSAARNCQ